MADVVTSTVLENGNRRAVMAFTSVSDGTGESGVVKVNATSSGSLGVVVQGQTVYPGVHLKIVDVWSSVRSMGLRIQWDAFSATDALVLGEGIAHWPLLDGRGGFQGIANPNNTGATGSILFTTINANNNASYTVILSMVKAIPQS